MLGELFSRFRPGKETTIASSDGLLINQLTAPEASLTSEGLDLQAFQRYLGQLTPSLERVIAQEKEISLGDTYLARRKNGAPMILLPLHIAGWATKRRLKDLLLTIAFNPQQDIIGFESTCLDLDYGDHNTISANPLVASTRGGEGIGSAVREVSRQAAAALLLKYHTEGGSYTTIVYNTIDEHGERLSELTHKVEANKATHVDRAELSHAMTARPRWNSLFPTNERVTVRQDDDSQFCRNERRTHAMQKQLKANGGYEWIFSHLPEPPIFTPDIYNPDFITLQMRKALRFPAY